MSWIGIPPKYAIADAIGKLKGKSVILIHKRSLGRGKNLAGYHFGAHGYCVSTVGLDETLVGEYICNQETGDKAIEQYSLLSKMKSLICVLAMTTLNPIDGAH